MIYNIMGRVWLTRTTRATIRAYAADAFAASGTRVRLSASAAGTTAIPKEHAIFPALLDAGMRHVVVAQEQALELANGDVLV